jgi:fumarate hydratase class II
MPQTKRSLRHFNVGYDVMPLERVGAFGVLKESFRRLIKLIATGRL